MRPEWAEFRLGLCLQLSFASLLVFTPSPLPPAPADEGIVDVTAHSVTLKGAPRVLHRDATTGAATGARLAACPPACLCAQSANAGKAPQASETRRPVPLPRAPASPCRCARCLTPCALYCASVLLLCTAPAVLYEVELDRGLPWLDALQQLEQHREAAAAPKGASQLPPVVLAASTLVDGDDGKGEQPDVKIEQQQQQEPEQVKQEQQQQEPEQVKQEQQQQQPEQVKQEQQQPGSSDSVHPRDAVVVACKAGKRLQAGAASDVGSTAEADAEEAGTEADAKRRKTAKGKQPVQRQKQEQGEEEEEAAVDLTGSTDSDGETAAAPAAGAAAAAGGAKPAAGKQLSGGGFFRARQEGINRQVGAALSAAWG